ncbi:co-chaperone GroES [Candidatus Bipolaricaulota bacterium]|jgi:chaperonin GroES|nr:co-chaperone GroES [Candidatus Bipolaricaulota bacterium]
MKIKPLGKRILAKKLEPEERKTAGGIVLPESAKSDKVVRAKILELGTDEKFNVKKGDEILVSSFAGTEIEADEEKLLLVKESDVLAVIE